MLGVSGYGLCVAILRCYRAVLVSTVANLLGCITFNCPCRSVLGLDKGSIQSRRIPRITRQCESRGASRTSLLSRTGLRISRNCVNASTSARPFLEEGLTPRQCLYRDGSAAIRNRVQAATSSLGISQVSLFVGFFGAEPACGTKISCVSCRIS